MLLPVALTIALVGLLAWLIAGESALEAHQAADEFESARAEYVAEAGFEHALRDIAGRGCGPYADLTSVAFAGGQYDTRLTSGLGATAAYTLAVDQDAWIGSFQASLNHGGDANLHIGQAGGDGERALLRYDLSALPAGAAILSATAWFHVDAGHPEGPLEAHRLTADWGEADATWDSMAANLDGAVSASLPPQAAAGAWVAVNLTGQVQAWVNGEPNYGLALAAITENVNAVYGSRESANPPYLEVVVGAPPSSPAGLKSTATLASGATAAVERGDVTLRQRPGFAQLQPDAAAGEDTYLYQWKPTWNYGTQNRIWVEDRFAFSRANGLILFDLGGIPAGARITGATLELYQANNSLAGGQVGVYRVGATWDEGTDNGSQGQTNWTERDMATTWASPGGDFGATRYASQAVPSGSGWSSWEIGELVDGWVAGRFPNRGLLLYAETPGTAAHFASSDDTDPALRPKLTVRYACECGQVCAAPQGSGNLLLVVINSTTLAAEDQQAKALFESWGYTVNVIGENASQTAYDGGFAVNDVVFLSETVNPSTVGDKLVNAPIGVVSQDGDYNPALGFAAGSAHPVGDAVTITDSSHYITRPFAAGPLAIYTHPMEQLTVAGAAAAGLQTLADSAAAASLAVLDAGATAGGDIEGAFAAGRRVMLPLGTRYRFDWDRLNANGRLLLQRALDWGAGAEPTSAGDVLLVVPDPAALSAREAARQALIESWDYLVTLIDDDASPAAFDAAAVASDAVYVVSTIDEVVLSAKLDEASIGIVFEAHKLLSGFGMAGGSSTTPNVTSIDIVDNGHYITEEYPLGPLAILSAGQSVPTSESPVAAGLVTLGEENNRRVLDTLDAGATRLDSSPSPGRRVKLPWGGTGFDPATLTADGETIMRRALEWAAAPVVSAQPLAHWKLDETSGPTAVDSEGGHDGTLTGGPAWAPGMLQGGLYFDGVDDAIDIGVAPALDNLFAGPVTLSGWIYAGGWGAGQNGRIADKSNATLPGAGWAFELYGPNQALLFQAAFSGGLGSWATPAGSISLDSWHHVALVYDGSSAANDPQIYIDGSPQAVIRESAPSGTPIDDSPYNLTLGNHAAAPLRAFDGILDDIRLHDRLLTAAEIAALAVRPGPLAHWKLDESVGPTAVDSAGGHDGTWTNGPAPVPGVVDGGLAFDGSDDYVDAGSFDVIGSGITLMAWFNADSIATDDPRFVSKASGTNEGDAWWQLSTTDAGSDRYLRMRIKAGGTTTTLADSSVNLSAGSWYLAAATYDSVSGMMRLYLDGVEVASTAHSAGGALDSNPAVPVALGANGTAERFFDGVLDDVRIYDRALGGDEIADLYAASAPPGLGYYELHQPWSASTPDTWEVMELAPFGVPAGAVVEVAIIQQGISAERWGGVRAVGSALDRRFRLHEAEAGGVDALTLHVQADAGARIEHYAENTGQVSFLLLGYWNTGAYVELFEPFSAGAANAWIGEGVDDEGLGPNQVAEVVMHNKDGVAEGLAGVRRAGSGINRRFDLHEAENGGIDALSLMVETDAASTIEVYAEDNANIDFHVVGYWSVPPGSFTELGAASARSTPVADWGVKDVAALGVPPGSVTQFVITNDNPNAENTVGARALGSTANRYLQLHEAESGGSDGITMHANVDANSELEWYSESGTSSVFFYPVGAWVIAP